MPQTLSQANTITLCLAFQHIFSLATFPYMINKQYIDRLEKRYTWILGTINMER